MKKILMMALLGLLPFIASAQASSSVELLEELKTKRWYFYHLQGPLEMIGTGSLLLNGVEIPLHKTEVSYQKSDQGTAAYLVLSSRDGSEIYEFRKEQELVLKTNNLLHPVRSDEQAAELVVLLTMLQTLSAEKAG